MKQNGTIIIVIIILVLFHSAIFNIVLVTVGVLTCRGVAGKRVNGCVN